MKGQMEIAAEPLDITELEKSWRIYTAGNLTGIGLLNQVAWMGERMGLVLQEIRILRTQVKGLQAGLEYQKEIACPVA